MYVSFKKIIMELNIHHSYVCVKKPEELIKTFILAQNCIKVARSMPTMTKE